jgi:cobyrinic acid a,c-diamide synthase
VAGLGGDSGKSLLTIGLIGAFRRRGLVVAPFKKGPDFIDAAWLGCAAGREGRNLDTYLMKTSAIHESVAAAASCADIVIVEGNRGLFDGMTAKGEHATAALARVLAAPVLLVIDVTKVTRTVAAMVKGCATLETGLHLGGVVLNQVATRRQERIIREAVETETGIPVMGAVYRRDASLLPSRHLGLLTATEHPDVRSALDTAWEMTDGPVDIDAVLNLAAQAGEMLYPHPGDGDAVEDVDRGYAEISDRTGRPKIAVLKDRAFSFYYPENIEALERLGAELFFVSPIEDERIPAEIDGLYAGGGFPEVYAEQLARNEAFRTSLKTRIDRGLPVFAECGGLMFLARSLSIEGNTYPMVGGLPIDVAQRRRPRGHGYVSGRIDGETPFFRNGARIRGHEFHYSEIVSDVVGVKTTAALDKGVGIGGGRDGIVHKNITAFYTHFHALGEPGWAPGFMAAVSRSRHF